MIALDEHHGPLVEGAVYLLRPRGSGLMPLTWREAYPFVWDTKTRRFRPSTNALDCLMGFEILDRGDVFTLAHQQAREMVAGAEIGSPGESWFLAGEPGVTSDTILAERRLRCGRQTERGSERTCGACNVCNDQEHDDATRRRGPPPRFRLGPVLTNLSPGAIAARWGALSVRERPLA